MLIGVLLAPALADGVQTAINNANITGTAAAGLLGLVLTLYAVLIIYVAAKQLGAI